MREIIPASRVPLSLDLEGYSVRVPLSLSTVHRRSIFAFVLQTKTSSWMEKHCIYQIR